MKTIVELLNENGYKNTNTKRERSVKNLNLLLESGVMSIKFINADSYNSKENGRSFWFKSNDGKKYPTAYLVTLFGKEFYGHYIPKSNTTKYLKEVTIGNKYIYDTYTDYYDNTSLNINDIQMRVARIISLIRGKEDFLAPKIFAKYGECSCSKCDGLGVIPSFSYYANGICFDCGGSGINRDVLKTYINETINSVK